MSEIEEKDGGAVARFPCHDCGAKLEFKPGTEHLVCSYCGAMNEIAVEAKPIEEIDFHAMIAALESGAELEERATVKCDACAAEVDRPEKLTAFSCPFCGSDIVTKEGSRRLIKPRSLLPFKVRQREAAERFREWLGSLWFAPNALKDHARRDNRFQGIYLPYWTFDTDTISDYTGSRGEHYWVTETYTDRDANGNTVTRTRQVQKTRWYPASGRVSVDFDDVLVAASTSLPRKKLEALEPWDLPDLLPFEESFLSGFKAETYQVGLEEGFARGREIMDGPIRSEVRRDIGGDVQQIHSLHTRYDDLTFKHVLLPAWLDAYRYRDKIYRIVVNGRTGEVQGERPYSFWKIFFFVLFILAVIGGIVLVVQLNQ